VGDTERFVDKLAILQTARLPRRMGDDARETVEALFSERSMVNRYERLLLELCRTVSAPWKP